MHASAERGNRATTTSFCKEEASHEPLCAWPRVRHVYEFAKKAENCLELIVGRGQFFATRPVYAAKKNLMGTNGSDVTSDGIDKFHATPVPTMSTHLDSMCISLDLLASFLPLLLRLFVARD